jgi:hypothetical protein
MRSVLALLVTTVLLVACTTADFQRLTNSTKRFLTGQDTVEQKREKDAQEAAQRRAEEEERKKEAAKKAMEAQEARRIARQMYPKKFVQMERMLDYLEKKTGYGFPKNDRIYKVNAQQDALIYIIEADNFGPVMTFMCYDPAMSTYDTARITNQRYGQLSVDWEFNHNLAMMYIAEIVPAQILVHFKRFR